MHPPDDATPRPWHRLAEGSAEWRALAALGRELGTTLVPRQVEIPGGGRTEVEGVDAEGRVIAQLVVNSGAFKSAHRNKVNADMFKLLWLRTSAFPGARSILCITPAMMQAFAPNGWVKAAARDLGIEVYVWDEHDAVTVVAGPTAHG